MQLSTSYRKLSLLIAIVMAMVVSLSSQAQPLNQELIAFRNGDLWKFNIENNTATQLTEWGYNGGPILSPDGRKIAYLSTASEVVDAINSGQPPQFAGSPPSNIWVMDVATETFTRIADQSGSGEVGYLRSVPAWSPDSSKLIWSELNPNLQGYDQATLQIHDINTGLTTTFAQNYNMGFQDGGIWMPPVKWGAGGIARRLFTYMEGSRDPFLFMEIYDPSTGNLTRYDLGFDANSAFNNYVQDYVWVNHQGRSMLALRTHTGWELFDPTNGSRSALSAPPRLKASFISGGLELVPVIISDPNGGSQVQWQVVIGNSEYNTGYVSYGLDNGFTPSISPDASQIAWHNGDGVSTWQPGTGQTGRTSGSNQASERTYLIPAPTTVAWAPTEWITSDTDVVVQPTPTNPPPTTGCSLAPRLSVGQNAIVNPGPSNRVRVAATTNSAIIGNLDAGEVAYVEQGPVCNNGYHWYFVRNGRIAGWTAEGGNGNYWLSIDTTGLYCYNSPPTRLTSTSIAYVLPGEPNNLRDNVGTNGTRVVTVIPAGETFVVTGFPQCDAEGRRWYPIQYNQYTGWTAEGEGSEYWIAPSPGQSG